MPNRSKSGILSQLSEKNRHTRTRPHTHGRAHACTPTTSAYAHLQSHTHACKQTHSRPNARTFAQTLLKSCTYAQNTCTRAYTSENTRIHAQTNTCEHEHTCAQTHTPCYIICSIFKSLKQGKKLLTKEYWEV